MPLLKGSKVKGYIEINEKVRFLKNVAIEAYDIGDTYYVYSNGKDTYGGHTITEAFRTVAKAVDIAGEYDRIVVLPAHRPYVSDADPGQYAYLERDIPINITKMGLKIIGLTTSPFLYGSPTIHAHNAASTYSHPDQNGIAGTIIDTLFNIDANQVEISNLCIQMQVAAPAFYIAKTHQVNRFHIHHCALTGYAPGNGTYGIRMGTATGGTGSPSMVAIEDCLFTGWSAGAVELFAASGSVFRNNVVCVYDGAFGVEIKTTGLPWGLFVLDNRFIAGGTTASGIVITNQYGTGMLLIDGNHFNGFNSTTLAYGTYAAASHGVNYYNGALVTGN